jgi:hypothetical protein
VTVDVDDLELLADPVIDAVDVILLVVLGLAVDDVEKVDTVDCDEVFDGLVDDVDVTVLVRIVDDERVILTVGVTVFELSGFLLTVLEALAEPETVLVLVILGVVVCVLVMCGLGVIFTEPVPEIERVDVLLEDMDLVFVTVTLLLSVTNADNVSVLDALDDAECVDVTVDVLDKAGVRVGQDDAVVVFDDVMVPVWVLVIGGDLVLRAEAEKDGDDVDVLDKGADRESVGVALDVLEGCVVRVIVGLELGVFERWVLAVDVFEVLIVAVANPVLVGVFDKRALLVFFGDDDDVLEVVLVLVLVLDEVVVFVVVVDGETNLVANAERDSVVVFVEVLLFVDVDDNNTFSGPKFRSWAPAAINNPNNPNNLRYSILYNIYKLTLCRMVFVGRWVIYQLERERNLCSNILI